METRSSAEDELFGKFFGETHRCRQIMKESRAICCGSAVLLALLSATGSHSRRLEVYASRKALGRDGLLQWHQYFVSEGYEINAQCGEDIGDIEVSSILFSSEEHTDRFSVLNMLTRGARLFILLFQMLNLWSISSRWRGQHTSSVLLRGRACIACSQSLGCRERKCLLFLRLRRSTWYCLMNIPDLGSSW